MLVMMVGVVGLIGSMASGMKLVSQSKNRSAAVAAVQQHLERLHALPYTLIALREPLSHHPDPGHPDSDLTQGGDGYRLPNGQTEPLVMSDDGALAHEEHETVGATPISLFQYVTWVDDPTIPGSSNYKRAIVAGTWSNTSTKATRIIQSTFITDGSLSVTGDDDLPSPTSAPTIATPVPMSSGTPCAGDTTPPTGTMEVIASVGEGNDTTGSTSIQVRLDETDACPTVLSELSNDGDSFTRVAVHNASEASTVSWAVPPGDGEKVLYARFRDSAGNTSETLITRITLDQTRPTTPVGLTAVSCALGGRDRTVALSWNASTDTNLLGYRLFRSVDSEPFVGISATSARTSSDTERKSLGSVRYLIRAYDRAGNESSDSNVLAFTRNRC